LTKEEIRLALGPEFNIEGVKKSIFDDIKRADVGEGPVSRVPQNGKAAIRGWRIINREDEVA